jgi:hypothetical protein
MCGGCWGGAKFGLKKPFGGPYGPGGAWKGGGGGGGGSWFSKAPKLCSRRSKPPGRKGMAFGFQGSLILGLVEAVSGGSAVVLSRPGLVLKLSVLVEEVATGAQWGMLYRADATAAMEHVR